MKLKLEAFEMWIWRRKLKVSSAEHKTNDEVLELAEQRILITTLRQRQKNGWDATTHY